MCCFAQPECKIIMGRRFSSTEKQAAEYEGRMSAKDPGGWTTHRGRAKRQMREAPE